MKPVVFVVLLVCLISACHKEDEEIVFTDDGAWCWFSDPRAVFFKGKKEQTYSAWITSEGSIQVCAYNHRTDDIQSAVINTGLRADDHNNPAITITEEGKIMLFYTGHASRVPIHKIVSTMPEDISGWEEPCVLELNDHNNYPDFSQTYTYVNPVSLSDEGKMFIFWRGVDFKPNVSVSEDGGETWASGKIFILPRRIYRDRRPYLKVGTDNFSKMHFAFTDGHPRNEASNSIYYCRYYNEMLFKANGEKVCDWDDLPIKPEKCDLVFDGSGSTGNAWVWDVAADKDGNPVIVFVAFPGDSTVSTLPYRNLKGELIRENIVFNHMYYYAFWDGHEWKVNKLINSGKWFPMTEEGESEFESNYSAGLVLDQEDPSIVYLSRQVNGIFEIEKWITKDHGQSWESVSVTSASEYDNVRPVAVRNAYDGNPVQLMWMRNKNYISYRRFDSGIVGLKEN